MLQTRQESLEFLQEALEAVTALSAAVQREKQLRADEKRAKKELETEKKRTADEIQSSTKKRRGEITSAYGREDDKLKDQLRKTRSRREKAKNQGVKERIAEETAALREQNGQLLSDRNAAAKNRKLPAVCRVRLYYTLFTPRWAKEYLICLVLLLLVFIAVPWGVYFLIPDHRLLYLAIIYPVDIVVFGGLFAYGSHLKFQHAEALREGRQYLDEFYANNKKIHQITVSIRRDKNESLYNLQKFDDDIARLEQERADVEKRKTEALNTFDTVTKDLIHDEIELAHRERTDSLSGAYAAAQKELAAVGDEIKERNLALADTFTGTLGQDFMDAEKIRELIRLIEDGEAENVREAKERFGKPQAAEKQAAGDDKA